MVAHVTAGLTALQLVAERRDPLEPIAVGELARRLGRPLSGTSRLCAELERSGMLERAGAYGTYRLGAAAIRMSGRAAAPYAHAVRHALTAAAQLTGETAVLAAPARGGFSVVAVVESIWTLHAPAALGERITEPSGAIPRAARGDDGPPADAAAGIRESNFGLCVELAAPVIGPAGDCVAVIAVRLPVNRREQNGDRALRAIRGARRRLEAALSAGYSGAPHGGEPAAGFPGDAPSALDASFRILNHLAQGADTVVGVASATGLRPDRTQRLIDACARAGFVSERDEAGRVQPSWAIHGWYRASTAPLIVARGKPLVAEVANRTRTCGFITVLKGMRSLTLVEELEMAGEGLRMAPWLGRAHPLIGSDGGPTLVMDFVPEELAGLFPARVTPRELKVFGDRVRRVQRDGVLTMEAFDDAGIVSISAPVLDSSGTVAAAVCLVGTTAYMYANAEEFARAAQELAERVSAELLSASARPASGRRAPGSHTARRPPGAR